MGFFFKDLGEACGVLEEGLNAVVGFVEVGGIYVVVSFVIVVTVGDGFSINGVVEGLSARAECLGHAKRWGGWGCLSTLC